MNQPQVRTALLVVAPLPAAAQGWGAIAVAPAGAHLGTAINHGSRGQAERIAMDACSGYPAWDRRCHVIAAFQFQCASVAAGGEFQGSAIWRSKDHGATWTHALLGNGKMDD